MDNKKKQYSFDPESQNGTYVKTAGGGKKGWSGREKCLAGLTVVLAALSIALIVVVAVKLPEAAASPNDDTSNICMTPECIVESSVLLNAINESIDPCDDFYDFACGKWMKSRIVPDDKSSLDIFGELRDDVQLKLKVLLEDNSASSSTAITKAKAHYAACINEEEIARRGKAIVFPLLSSLGGWPVLNDSWSPESFNFEELLINLAGYNNKPVIDVYVGTDDRNSSARVITVDQSDLGMPNRDYYLGGSNAVNLEAYKTLAIKAAMMFGASKENATKQMNATAEFEVKIAQIMMPEEDRRDYSKLYNVMTVDELHANISGFDWLYYLQKRFDKVNITINGTERLVVYAPVYLKNAVDLVRQTDNRTVTNYLIWRILKNRLGNLGEADREILREFNKVLFGTKIERSRWRSCVDEINSYMGRATGRMFVDKYFDSTAKDSALDMIKYLRKKIKELLSKAEWMDESTRRYALDKAEAMMQKIGYPDEDLNNTRLDEEYENLIFNSSTYFENVLTYIQDVAIDSIKYLHEAVNKSQWTTTAAIVNAFYNPSYNDITFPAGILQPPFYSKDFPRSLVFGGIGMVIGHEITHGFDDEGSQYDKNGNLHMWWSPSSLQHFQNKTKCLEDQYSNFSLQGEHIRGKQTLGENLADNGGLKAAYLAYQDWVAQNGQEKKLPGLKYTHDQLLFINFAHGWCSISKPQADRYLILTDAHSPGRFRVLGSVSNLEYFARAFNCKQGSKMNPVNKCGVW